MAEFRDPSVLANYTPAFIGYHGTPNSAATVGTANRAFLIAVTVPASCTVTGMALSIGVQSGNIDVGLYNSSGTRVASSGSVACPAVSAKAQVSFTSSVAIGPGVYYLALACDNITATFSRFGTDVLIGVNHFNTSMPLPTTLTLPGTASSLPFSLALLVSGGVTQ